MSDLYLSTIARKVVKLGILKELEMYTARGVRGVNLVMGNEVLDDPKNGSYL